MLSMSGTTRTAGFSATALSRPTHTASGSITARDLDINAVTDSKVYDGTTSSGQTPAVGRRCSSDWATGLVRACQRPPTGTRTLALTAYTVNDRNGRTASTVHTA